MDYLVPMAGEMPDIHIAHIETPTPATTLGSRGVGEAGTVAAGAAIWTAVNDALSPFGAAVIFAADDARACSRQHRSCPQDGQRKSIVASEGHSA